MGKALPSWTQPLWLQALSGTLQGVPSQFGEQEDHVSEGVKAGFLINFSEILGNKEAVRTHGGNS